MASQFLNHLSADERSALVKQLHATQGGNCFICEKPINLIVQKASLDIDHVVPLNVADKDDASNLALTHASCNRSKQASNLEVARILQRFSALREKLAEENRSPHLGDVLAGAGGGNCQLGFSLSGGEVTYSLSEVGDNTLYRVPVYRDSLSGFRYFFAELPIQYLAHDAHINPRSIGANISKLVEEFFQKRPQLHVPLAWMRSEGGSSAIHVFDGQHKAAAQLLLGVKALPVRVFIDPDPDTLITTNTNAGTTLKQVAFDKSVQRHLGSSLYHDRLVRFQQATGRKAEDYAFSEKDLANHFKGESREMKRYVLDAVRDGVTSDPDNKLRDFIDLGGRGKERPLSYSTIEKTFYSFFVYKELLETPLDYRVEEQLNPRQLERDQILRLMNLVAEEIYIGRFDTEIGTDKIENQIQKGAKKFPLPHLTAYRMSKEERGKRKEEIVYNWLQYAGQIATHYFVMQGKPDPKERLFQVPFPPQIWDNIRKFLQNFSALPLWVNTDLSLTVFGGKQNNIFWKTVFESCKTPQGMVVLAKPINLIDMIK